MFEKWIAGQLMYLLGEYLEPSSFSSETVRVGVWSGCVVLDNACLKQGLLDIAPLPVHMTHGSIARIELRIPWSNLTKEPIELTIHGVYIVFRAEGEDKRIPGKAAKEARKQAFKKAKLSSAYMRRMDSLEETGQQGKRLGMKFFQRLVHRVLGSILVHMQGVHIRYEDAISNPLHPFCTGVTLASLHVYSAEKHSVPKSLEASLEHLPCRPNVAPLLAKTLQLSHLSVYWNAAQLGNPCSIFVGEELEENTHDTVASIMHLLVPRPDSNSSPISSVSGEYSSHLPPLGHNYLLAPVDATVDIVLFEGDAEWPATWTIDAHVSSITVCIYDWQYQDILCMYSSQAQYDARLKYQAERPHVGVMVDPKAWWAYAIATAIEEVKTMRNNGMDCWDLRDIGRRRALRLEYVSLWYSRIMQQLDIRVSSSVTAQLGVSSPTSYVETGKGRQTRQYCSMRLEELEKEFFYDDIIMFRAMAEKRVLSELRVQRGCSSTSGGTGPLQEKQGPSIIYSWVLSALGIHAEEGKCSATQPLGSSSDTNFERLCNIIDWDPDDVEFLSLPATKSDYNLKKDILRLHLNFQLDCGSISVRCCDIEGFIDLHFNALDIHCSTLGEKYDAIDVTVLLKDLGINEIGRNGVKRVILQKRRQDPEEFEFVSDLWTGGAALRHQHLFRIAVSSKMEQHCNNYDATLALTVDQVEIILHPENVWMELISAFLEPPEFLDYWEGLELDAANTLSSVAAQLDAKFHYFVDSRLRPLVDIDAKAPLVIIPVESGSSTAECIMFDLGRITFKTQKLATPDPSANAIAKATMVAEEEDKEKKTASSPLSSSFSPSPNKKQLHFPPFHSLYDAYRINVQHVELAYSTGDGMEYTLLNPLDIQVELFVCVIPKDPAMTQLWIRGDLPAVHLRLSDYVMKRLIDAGGRLLRNARAASADEEASAHRTRGFSNEKERSGGAMTSGTPASMGLAPFLDFQRTIGEYVDHRIDSSRALVDMQSDEGGGGGGGEALISVQQSVISVFSREGQMKFLIESEEEESFFDAISEDEPWSVDDETNSSSSRSSVNDHSSLDDIEGEGEQCRNVKENDIPSSSLNDHFDQQQQPPFESYLSSLMGEEEVKDESTAANDKNLEILSSSSIASEEDNQPSPPRPCENRFSGVENSHPVVECLSTPEPADRHRDSLEVLQASRNNNIERRASKPPPSPHGFIPLNRDILRSTFTLPFVNIEVVRSGGRFTYDDNVPAVWTTNNNEVEMETCDDVKPIVDIELTGIDVHVHVRTGDATVILSVSGFSIMDCLKKLRGGGGGGAEASGVVHQAVASATRIPEYCHRRHLPVGKGSNSTHFISATSFMLSSELFRPHEWVVPGRHDAGSGYLGELCPEGGAAAAAASDRVLPSSHYISSRRNTTPSAADAVRRGSSDFLKLSLNMSKPPEENRKNLTDTGCNTEAERCKVSIDLNALELAIEQSSALAILQLLGNVLSTEDELSERHFIKDSSNHRHHAAGAAIKTPSSVRSFSKEMEYFQSVRVNISTIATYLVEDGLDISSIVFRGAKCLLETEKSGKIHVWLKCMNLQVLDLIANGDAIRDESATAATSASSTSSVPEQQQQRSHNKNNVYGIGGSSRSFYGGGGLSSPHHLHPHADTTAAQELLGTMDENTPVLDVCFVTEIGQIIAMGGSKTTEHDYFGGEVPVPPSSLKIFVGSIRVVAPSPTFCERIANYVLYGPLFPYLVEKFGGLYKSSHSSSSSIRMTTTAAEETTRSPDEEQQQHLDDVASASSSAISWQIPPSGLYIEFSVKKPLFVLPAPRDGVEHYHQRHKEVFFILTVSQLFVGVALRPLQCINKVPASSLHSDGGGVLVCVESALVGLSITLEPETEGVLLPFNLNLSMHYVQSPPRDTSGELAAAMKRTISSSRAAAAMDVNVIEDTLRDDGMFLWERLVEHLSRGEKNVYFSTTMALEKIRTPHLPFVSWSGGSNLAAISVSASAGSLRLYSCNDHLEILLGCIKCWTKCFKSIKQQCYDVLSPSFDDHDVRPPPHSSSFYTGGRHFQENNDNHQTRAPQIGGSFLVMGEACISVEALEFTLFSNRYMNDLYQPLPQSSLHHGRDQTSPSEHQYYDDVEKRKEDDEKLSLNVRDVMTSTNNTTAPEHDEEAAALHYYRHQRTMAAVTMEITPIFYFIAKEIEFKASSLSGGGMVPALLLPSLKRCCHKEEKESDNTTTTEEELEEKYKSLLSLTVFRAEAAVPEGGRNKWHRGRNVQQQQEKNNNPFLTPSLLPETTTVLPTSQPLLRLRPLNVRGRGDDSSFDPPTAATPSTSSLKGCANNDVTDGRYGLIIRCWNCMPPPPPSLRPSFCKYRDGCSDDHHNKNKSDSSSSMEAAWRAQCFVGGLSIAVLPEFVNIAAPTIFTFLPLLSRIVTTVSATKTTKKPPVMRRPALTLHLGIHGTELWLPAEKNITPDGKSLVLSWCTSAAGEWSACDGALSTPFRGWITVNKVHVGTCRLKWMHHSEIMPLPCGDASYFEETLVWPFSCTATFTHTLPDSGTTTVISSLQSRLFWSNEFRFEMDIIEGTWRIDSSLPIKVWFASLEPLITESKKWGGLQPTRRSAREGAVSAETEKMTTTPLSSPILKEEIVGVSRLDRRNHNKLGIVNDESVDVGDSLPAPSHSGEQVVSEMPALEAGAESSSSSPKLFYPWRVHVTLQGIRILGLHSSSAGGRRVLKGTPVIVFELLQVEGGTLIVGNEDVASTDTTTPSCLWSSASAWAETRIQVDYFNRLSSAWEPLLEPWGARVDAKASWTIMSLKQQSDGPRPHHQEHPWGDLSPPTRLNIEATAKQVLNVNISEGLIDTIAGVLRALEKYSLNTTEKIECHSRSSSRPIATNTAAVLNDPYCDTTLSTFSIAGLIRNEAGMTIAVLCFHGKEDSGGTIMMKDTAPTKSCCTEKLILSDHLLSAERDIRSGDSIPLVVTSTNGEETAPSTWRNQDYLLRGSQRGSGCGSGLFMYISAHYPGYPSTWRSASPLCCSQLGYQEHLLLYCEDEERRVMGSCSSSTVTPCTSMLRLYVDVKVKAGAMFITVHSAFRLVNQMPVPLHVSLGSIYSRWREAMAVDWDAIIAPGMIEPVPAPLAAVATTTLHAAFSIKPILDTEQDQAAAADAFSSTVFSPITIQVPRILENKDKGKRPGVVRHRVESNSHLDLQQQPVMASARVCNLKFIPIRSDGMANVVSSSCQKKMCCIAAVTQNPQCGGELLVCPPIFICNFLAVSAEVEISSVNEQQKRPKNTNLHEQEQQQKSMAMLSIDSGSTGTWSGCTPNDVFSFRLRMQGFEWSTQCVVQPSSSIEIPTASHHWSTVRKPIIDGVTENGESEKTRVLLSELWVDIVDTMCCKANFRLRIDISTNSFGVRYLSLWVPYWIVNSSGLPLQLALDKGTGEDKGEHGGSSATFLRTSGRNSWFEQPPLPSKALCHTNEEGGSANFVACSGEEQYRSKTGNFLIRRWQPSGIGIQAAAHWVTELDKGDSQKQLQLHLQPQSGGGQKEECPLSVTPPLMMGYTTEPDELNGRGCGFIRARVPGAYWSSPFSCDQAGVEGELEIRGQQTSILSRLLSNASQKEMMMKNLMGRGPQAFSLGLSINIAEGGFHRTKVVTIVPRYIIVNEMIGPLEVTQSLNKGGMRRSHDMVVEGGSITVPSGSQSPWHWPLAKGPRLLRCRIDEPGCEWSGQFDPSQIGDQNLSLCNGRARPMGLCRVDVDLRGPIVYLVFQKMAPNMAPYHIENSSIHTLTFGQVGCEQLETLEPYTSCAYAWDEPLRKRLLQIMVRKRGGRTRLLALYPLDEVRLFNTVRNNLKVEVVAVGPTRVLRITQRRQSSTIGGQQHRISTSLSDEETPAPIGACAPSSSAAPSGDDTTAEGEALGAGSSSSANPMQQNLRRTRSTSFLHTIAGTIYGQLTEERRPGIVMQQQSESLQTTDITSSIHLHSVGVSVVNATPRELLYFSVGGIKIDFASEQNQHTISVTVRHLQVDNQLFRTQYPLLLYPLNAAIPNASSTAAALGTLHCTSSSSSSSDGVVKGLRITMIVEQSSNDGGIDSSKIFLVKLVRISLAPLDVNLDGALVMDLLKMYSRATETLTIVNSSSSGGGGGSVAGGVVGQRVITAQGVLASLTPPRLYRHRPPTPPSAKLYFEELIIDPIRVHVSFRLEGTAAAHDPLDYVGSEDEKNHGNVIAVCGNACSECYNVTRVCAATAVPSDSSATSTSALLKSMGAQLASVENVPLALNALVLTHTFASAKDLGNQLRRHYQRQILLRTFKIIGSAQLLGNPIAFLQNIASGVKDFLYEPVAGLRDGSMKGFVLGVVKGTLSLLRRTSYSLAETLQLIAGNVSSFLLVSGYVPLLLTSPSQRVRDGRGRWTRHGGGCGVHSATEQYVTKGEWFKPSGIFSGVCLGLVGLARDPLWGFVKHGGLKGLITGMCRGGIGLLVRPAYGGLVAVESIGRYVCQFINPTLGPAQKQRMQRVRPPRFFRRCQQPLTAYSKEENAGEELLRRATHGRHRIEGYVWHETVGASTYLLTRRALLVLHQTDSLFNPSVEITIPLCCVVWAEVVENDNGPSGVGIYDIDDVEYKMGFHGLRVRYTIVHTALSKTPHDLLGLIKHHS